MTDVFETRYRSRAVGSLRPSDAGQPVRLAGWVHRRRDLGGLAFLDLRDRAGIVQVSVDPAAASQETLQLARHLGPEDVVEVEGTVELRPTDKANPELATGGVEVRATAVRILQAADPLPIPVYRAPDEELPMEDLRLRYRYLDLRRPELQRNLILRHRAARAARSFLDGQGFIEVETPLLTRRTPEGARDYLVPSRVHPGEFFALPQSPQLYKQLLMVSGFDRYYQIVKCLRDEDLRADRQPEFTQIDVEMAFVDQEDVFRIGEGLMRAVWRETLDVELTTPFPRLSYAEAMYRYGTDKPDLRIAIEAIDVTDILQRADFRLFQATIGTAQRIRGMRIPGGARLSRKELDELQAIAKKGGAPGALWVKRTEEGWSGQFARALDQGIGDRFAATTALEVGDLFVAVVGDFRVHDPSRPSSPHFAAGQGAVLEPAIDELRRHLAARMDLTYPNAHAWLWVTEFPLFDWDSENQRLMAAHHPFTNVHPDDQPALEEATEGPEPISAERARALYPLGLRSLAYDAVYNGHELASGSVRIHDAGLQQRIFRSIGLSSKEAQRKFGFLLEAFRFGAPPHAGFAFGFDRIVMLAAGATSLRDVIAFPKTTAARALFEGAPDSVSDNELRELHITIVEQAK
jgi:aspartyl-tRNA synthetase